MNDVLACLRDVLNARELSEEDFIITLHAFEEALDRHIDERVYEGIKHYHSE